MVYQKTHRDLILAHPGARICVMGGAPCLEEDLRGLEADVWISVNQHGIRFKPISYVVAMDDHHSDLDRGMYNFIHSLTDAPIIGPFREFEYFLTDWPCARRRILSGMVAAWLAWLMGAWPVILAGFNYQADQKKEDQATKYAKVVDQQLYGPVRAVGRTLYGIWPQYQPGEDFGPYEPHSTIRGHMGCNDEIQIRLRKPSNIFGRDYPAGTELAVMRHEVRLLLKHRMVEEIKCL